MNPKDFRILCLLLCIASCFPRVFAQGCGVVMTRNYSSYATASTDGARIYTSVLIDGSASCTPTPSCPCGSATHTPKAENVIGGVGGWGSGTPQCVNCYLSYQNNQNIVATHAQNYQFTSDGEVVCSLAGTFFNSGGVTNLSIRDSYWGPPVTITKDQCYYGSLACSPGTTATCPNGTGVTFVPACPPYVHAEWLYDTAMCQFISPPLVNPAKGPGACN